MAPFRNGSVLESKYEDGEWKSRTNCKLEELSKGENIVKWIKGQRISWLGQLERMEEDRVTIPPMRINLINQNCETFRSMQYRVLLKHKDSCHEAMHLSATRSALQTVDQTNTYSNNLMRFS